MRVGLPSLRARRALARAATAAWAAAIFIASELPRGHRLIELPRGGTDKLVHAAVYLVLGALAGLALRVEGQPRARAAWRAALLATLYGLTDELHQSTTPGRDASPADLLADAIGATLGAAVAAALPDPRGAQGDAAAGEKAHP